MIIINFNDIGETLAHRNTARGAYLERRGTGVAELVVRAAAKGSATTGPYEGAPANGRPSSTLMAFGATEARLAAATTGDGGALVGSGEYGAK